MTIKSKGSRRIRRDKDEAPELNTRWVAEANLYRGRKLVRRGRPPGTSNKT